jgi:hypothetical protein
MNLCICLDHVYVSIFDHVSLSLFGPCIIIYLWTMYYYLCLEHVSVSMSGPCIGYGINFCSVVPYVQFVRSTFYVQFIQVQVVIYSSSSTQVQVVIYSSAPYNISSGHNTSPHSSSHSTLYNT